ncbi:AMP-forming long-chain acyl-CoA synthetase [Rivularia sp. PCC 7116]|uniref:AMP-binding protein n=1 Tax=Rivularia sp. PCC 7116 TaxID=373994 RepID=UPI00029F46CF|nr:AMP-binding protein [Rivularia sp. PCC 7116]AFY53436.1 AMP-forming long-chain acyl-CoA synthetase [Rivularia sp. PCC 7116]
MTDFNFLKAYLNFVNETPEEIIFHRFENKKINTYTWGHLHEEVCKIAAYIESLKLPQKSNIGIFSSNHPEWIITDLAIMLAGHVSVPIYPLIGKAALRDILADAELKLLFLGTTLHENIIDKFAQNLPVVHFSHYQGGIGTSFHDILKADLSFSASYHPQPNDLLTIIYTSGTTNKSKGVMHSLASMSGLGKDLLNGPVSPTKKDRLFAYGTFAHISERIGIELSCFYTGCSVYFAESRETILADLVQTKPTILFGNPMFWQRLKAGILSKCPQNIINEKLKNEGESFQKSLRQLLGLDCARHVYVGASAIEPKILQWFHDYLGLSIKQVYGSTEGLGICSINYAASTDFGCVGEPLSGIDISIGENDEILYKSPSLTIGYYQNPQATSEIFTADGFFKSGDSGYIKNGQLFIKGRIQENFKTARSNMVFPNRIECMLTANGLLENVCVLGEGRMQPFAVATLATNWQDKFGNLELVEELKDCVAQVNSQLQEREHIDRLFVTDFEWNQDNGFLTSTMKIARRNIAKYFQKVEVSEQLQIEWKQKHQIFPVAT